MYLITGGAGFIGANMAHTLTTRSQQIVICDRIDKDHKQQNLLGLPLHEIISPDQLSEWLAQNAQKLAGIIHMGAISDTRCRDIDALLRNNFHLTRQLWDVATTHEMPFIYASSAATYGSLSHCIDANDHAQMMTLRPNNAYGWSKWIFDLYALRAKQAPPKWFGLKFFNVFGPLEHHKGPQSSVVLQFWQQIRDNCAIKLFQSRNDAVPNAAMARDFVWIDDCIDIMLWLLDNDCPNGVMNCGSGRATSFEDMANSVIHHMQSQQQIEYIAMPNDIAQHYQYKTIADMGRIKRLGYTSTATPTHEAIGKYIHHLQRVRESVQCPS